MPILGVPIPSKHLKGLDSLLSIVQMPKGVPVATFAIGEAGASNAALFAIAMQATNAAASGGELADKLHDFRQRQESKVLSMQLPRPE